LQLVAIPRVIAWTVLLGLRVAPPPLHPAPGVLGWIRAGLTDPVGWRASAYLVLKLPVSVLSSAVT
jgi:hypothetical protein